MTTTSEPSSARPTDSSSTMTPRPPTVDHLPSSGVTKTTGEAALDHSRRRASATMAASRSLTGPPPPPPPAAAAAAVRSAALHGGVEGRQRRGGEARRLVVAAAAGRAAAAAYHAQLPVRHEHAQRRVHLLGDLAHEQRCGGGRRLHLLAARRRR